MNITVDTAEMKARSREMQSVGNDLLSYMDQVEQVVLSIGGEWQGEAERAYAARIVYIKEQFARMFDFLDSYGRLLDEFSTRYEEHDKELSAKINLS